jgi:enoyl-CoA hydratase
MEHPDGGEVSVDEYTRIDVDRPADGVAWVGMDRPEMRNAQDTRMLAELDDAFERADRDPDVDCIVFAGAGNDFSSGHDLSDEPDDPLNEAFWEQHAEGIEDQMRVEREFFFDHAMRLRDLDTPTVASVQGNCVLAGIMLADVCDLIVAGEIAVLPLMFGAWRLALAFSIVNAAVLWHRIRIEDQALAPRRALAASDS